MQLFWSPTSPYARKVLVAADELGIRDRIELVPTVTKDEPDALLAVNPTGKIPVLKAQDLAIPGSAVICEYLDATFGGHSLLPASGPQRWRQRARAEQADAMLDAAMLVRAERLRAEAARSAEWERRQMRKVQRSLDLFEAETGDASAAFGLAEISLACALSYFRLRFAQDGFFATRPKLDRWMDAVSRRPSMQATQPPAA